jgi:hypothetical protein
VAAATDHAAVFTTGVHGLMLWDECDRPGALRAFRVVRPDELRLEHWFEMQPAADTAAQCVLTPAAYAAAFGQGTRDFVQDSRGG